MGISIRPLDSTGPIPVSEAGYSSMALQSQFSDLEHIMKIH